MSVLTPYNRDIQTWRLTRIFQAPVGIRSASDKWDLPSFLLFLSAHKHGSPPVHIHSDRSTVNEIIPHRKGWGDSIPYALHCVRIAKKSHLANRLCCDYFFIAVVLCCPGVGELLRASFVRARLQDTCLDAKP